MALRITPEMIEGLYEWLRIMPPFRAWKLPHADEVEFRVTAHRDRAAHFRGTDELHGSAEIAVSINGLAHHGHLIQAMAHEMIHFYLDRRGMDDVHGPNFQKAAGRVCKAFGWDYKDFIDED